MSWQEGWGPAVVCGGRVATRLRCPPSRSLPEQMVTRTKKIFVGGLSVNTTVDDVKQYFEQFGKVGECGALAKA